MQIRYEINRKAIGRRLKKERINRDLTQEKMAEIIGISSKYLSKIENGAAFPSLPYILKFAERTGSDLNILLLGRYPPGSGCPEGLVRELSDPYDGPDINLSRRNRRICNEITKEVTEVLKEWNT